MCPLGWFREGGSLTRVAEDAFDLAYDGGHVVVMTAAPPAGWQIAENDTAKKGAFNRAMLENGEMLPPEFTRPEVSKVLLDGIKLKKQAPDEG